MFPYLQTCYLRLVFNELSSKNLEHTSNIAVTLSKFPINTSLNARIALNPFKNRGWPCELLFFYVTGNTLLSGSTIKFWLKLYTSHYIDWKKSQRNKTYLQFKYLKLHCPGGSKILKYFKSFLETGIYHYYSEKYIRNRTSPEKIRISKGVKEKLYKSNKHWERVTKLDLQTGVNTLFLILIVMLGCVEVLCFLGRI